ncbi:hypothetical protein [Photobacterium angustum]|uniref:hypothetical protein n=1 Tax=Photobacterium angustum TaxID=661 RepID=UPI0005E469C4|nr:hypothetical protein [Photobacterium angustum]KJF94101.1 hypothetical protein UB39_11740 [Photobacterium angustum]PSW78842.1 hypothetical protein CTN03_18190 [Photobacterium angustum]
MFWKKNKSLLEGLVLKRSHDISLVEQLEKDIKLYVSETNDSTEQALERIYAIMSHKNLCYEEAVKTHEGREVMYQLLLHRQWIGFQLELLRAEKAKSLGVKKVGYKDSRDSVVMPHQMNALLDQFMSETSDFFKAELKSFDAE